MQTLYRVLTAALFIAFLFALVSLAREQNGSPPHREFDLPGGEPATLYLPGSANAGPGANNPFYQMFPASPEKRPPAVLLVHGFSGDRTNVSSLARRIAQNGYGVLTIDVRGHGANRNPFSDSEGGEGLREDLQKGVDFLRRSDLVDGSRVVVMGHSMGAGASLDFATHDPSLRGAVMISGGFALRGPDKPRNTLFIFASGDPEFIQTTSLKLAAHLAGTDNIELRHQAGNFADGSAVEAIRIPGVNHITIIWSPEAAQDIIKWLDGACGVQRTGDLNLADPRLNTTLMVLGLFMFLIVPVGYLSGKFAPHWEHRPGGMGEWLGLAVLAIGLFAAMELVAVAPPFSFVPLVVGSIQISWIAAAGFLLIAYVAFQEPEQLRPMTAQAGASAVVAVLAFALVFVMMAYDVTLHRADLTPERAIAMVAAAALVLPFFIAFEALLRRGGTPIATLAGALGRVVIVVTMVVGIGLGVIPFVVSLVIPLIVIQFVMMEIFAAAAYSASGNLMLIAIVESLWFARMITLASPITFKF